MSAFVWLDYSERERRKMLDVIDMFREHGTRDELGVGSVRDAFADMLFPGTSTIMTRARYFLLVPWAYQRLEKSRVRSAEIAARARQAELNLVEPIERSDDNDGSASTSVKVQKATPTLTCFPRQTSIYEGHTMFPRPTSLETRISDFASNDHAQGSPEPNHIRLFQVAPRGPFQKATQHCRPD